MSRYLAAFFGGNEKSKFSETPIPNKAEKAKNTHSLLSAPLASRAAEEFSPFSGYSGARVPKNRFLEAGAPEALGSTDEHIEIPAEPCSKCAQSVWWQPRSGESWRCDICDPHPDGWPPARTIDLDERLAIVEEALLPSMGTKERDRVDTKQAEVLTGLAAASLKRPPSWWHPKPHNPAPGVVCSCCRGRDWWSRDRLGWCCSGCKPPPPGQDLEVWQ